MNETGETNERVVATAQLTENSQATDILNQASFIWQTAITHPQVRKEQMFLGTDEGLVGHLLTQAQQSADDPTTGHEDGTRVSLSPDGQEIKITCPKPPDSSQRAHYLTSLQVNRYSDGSTNIAVNGLKTADDKLAYSYSLRETQNQIDITSQLPTQPKSNSVTIKY